MSLCLALGIGGCGFTTGSSSEPPKNVTVSVSPSNASVSLGATVQFTANVTGAAASGVDWSVDSIPGGNTILGTISGTGLYTAPPAMPSSSIVTVTATTQSTPQASGSATVQLQSGVAVSIAPTSAALTPGATAAFTATVTGTGTQTSAVNWTVNGVSGGNASLGTLSITNADAATYTAPAIPPSPASVSVTVTSVADTTKAAAAIVAISCGSANSISPASSSVATGVALNLTASLCVAPGTPVAWIVNGIAGGNSGVGTIAATGSLTATYTAPAAVPTANPVTIEAIAGTQTAFASITIAASAPIVVTVSPASFNVTTGQSASFAATVTGTSDAGVTWAVNGVLNGDSVVGEVCAPGSNPCVAPSGAENFVNYLAPQTQPPTGSVTLTATSQADPVSTGTAQITITSPPQPGISLVPFYAFLEPSQQFQFIANVAGVSNTGVTWTISSAVSGQGCSGQSCGSIDNAGNFTAPAAAPSPNAISVTAASVANPSLMATATVAVISGPTIETVLPSSVIAGPQRSFQLAVKGLNFVATTGSGTSQLLVDNSPRTTSCPTVDLCTITLQPSDVAAAGTLSIELQNPGTPATLSNPVSVVILPAPTAPSVISLTSAAAASSGNNITVVEPTTAGATTSPINVEFVGVGSADGSSCTIQASAIAVTRPASGTATVNICVQGNYLDPTFTYSFSSPQTGGDIGISTSSMASLLPNLIELTLTISSQTAPGLRTLFVTTPNGDVAAATGVLEVQ